MKRIALALLLMTVCGSGARAEDLLQLSDLHYVGAFRSPAINSGNGDSGTLAYGGHAMGFNPGAPGSLFISCFQPDATVAEISIVPALNDSIGNLNTATVVQGCQDSTAGGSVSIGSGDAWIGGLLVYNGKLITSKYIWYDANGDQTNAFFVKSNTNLSQANAAGAFQIGGAPNEGFLDGGMAYVPTGWRAALKGPVISGNDSLSIISRTSWGPDAFAWDPAQLTNVNNAVSSTPLFYFPSSHPSLGQWDGATPDDQTIWWNNSGNGYRGRMVIPDGARTALYFGSQGMDPLGMCYGEGTSNAALNRQPVPGEPGVINCYDPVNASKGTHGYPYRFQIMAFDLNDLAAVAAGSKQPWDVRPYAVWPLTQIIGADGSGDIASGGVAYDPVMQRIYFSAPGADGTLPLIHVFQVSLPAAPPSGGGLGGGGSGDSPPSRHVFWPGRGEEAVMTCAESANVFDRDGRDVADLASDGSTVRWNGKGKGGEMEAAGVYLIRCGHVTSKAVLIK